MPETGGKIKPASEVKFMKFMVSRRFPPALPGSRKRKPPALRRESLDRPAARKGRLARIGFGASRRRGRTARLARESHGIAGGPRAAGLGSFEVSASHDRKRLCPFGDLAPAALRLVLLSRVEHVHVLEHSTNSLREQVALPPSGGPLMAGSGSSVCSARQTKADGSAVSQS
jgi:hypothetical protein